MRSRRYRNRRIGDFLKELHLIEGSNTGIPTAIKSIKENNSYDVATEDIASILKLSQESWDKIAKIAYYGYKYNFNGYYFS